MKRKRGKRKKGETRKEYVKRQGDHSRWIKNIRWWDHFSKETSSEGAW